MAFPDEEFDSFPDDWIGCNAQYLSRSICLGANCGGIAQWWGKLASEFDTFLLQECDGNTAFCLCVESADCRRGVLGGLLKKMLEKIYSIKLR